MFTTKECNNQKHLVIRGFNFKRRLVPSNFFFYFNKKKNYEIVYVVLVIYFVAMCLWIWNKKIRLICILYIDDGQCMECLQNYACLHRIWMKHIVISGLEHWGPSDTLIPILHPNLAEEPSHWKLHFCLQNIWSLSD